MIVVGSSHETFHTLQGMIWQVMRQSENFKTHLLLDF